MEFARAFSSTPTFEATLAGIAVSPLSNCFLQVHGDIDSLGPVERITLSFPSTLALQEQDLFNRQIEHLSISWSHMI